MCEDVAESNPFGKSATCFKHAATHNEQKVVILAYPYGKADAAASRPAR